MLVRACGLGKVFRTGPWRPPVVAVADASFEVAAGEILALYGPNGAGKTTTLAMLAGLVFPTAGRAEVGGVTPAEAVTRGQVGYVAERPALYGHLTPEQMLDLGGTL